MLWPPHHLDASQQELIPDVSSDKFDDQTHLPWFSSLSLLLLRYSHREPWTVYLVLHNIIIWIFIMIVSFSFFSIGIPIDVKHVVPKREFSSILSVLVASSTCSPLCCFTTSSLNLVVAPWEIIMFFYYYWLFCSAIFFHGTSPLHPEISLSRETNNSSTYASFVCLAYMMSLWYLWYLPCPLGFFAEASMDQVEFVKTCHLEFSKAFGQKINFAKLKLFFFLKHWQEFGISTK